MDPQAQFCPNPDYPARGQLGLSNLRVHSRKERRYRCTTCGRTFAATHDTPLYRLKKPAELVTIVLTLLCHGCPLQAIVVALGLDERTVAAWRDRAGRHGQHFHEQHVLNGPVELGHVQADELYVRVVARRLWMAMAMAVPSRLWLGGVISPRRDLTLILTVGIYTAIFAATPWGDGSRRSGADLHRCRSYLSIRGRPPPQSLVSQGLRIRHPLVPSEGRHSRSVPSSCQ